jgi:hypothetical protein
MTGVHRSDQWAYRIALRLRPGHSPSTGLFSSSSRRCARCAAELAPNALACPACLTLVHGARLRELAPLATAATDRADRATARSALGRAHGNRPRPLRAASSDRPSLMNLADAAPMSIVGDHPPRTSGRRSWVQPRPGVVVAGKMIPPPRPRQAEHAHVDVRFVANYLVHLRLAAGGLAERGHHEMGHVSCCAGSVSAPCSAFHLTWCVRAAEGASPTRPERGWSRWPGGA